jgi:subtilisin family serine protease
MTEGDPTKAPHVINNSWSCPPSEGCTPDMLRDVVEAVRAAGIVTVQSAGNSGSQCGSVDTPAAIYDASFTAGAVSSSGAIAGFSGRGPAAGGLLKPDIVAPGVSVTSTIPGDGYGELSGTSMASPHVAGLVALLLSADPSLAGNPEAIEAAITQSAEGKTTIQGCGGDTDEAVPNNVYGWGLIDAAATIRSLLPLPYQIFTPFGAVGLAP